MGPRLGPTSARSGYSGGLPRDVSELKGVLRNR